MNTCRVCGTTRLGLQSVCSPCSRAAQYPAPLPRAPRRMSPRFLPAFCTNCRAPTLPGRRDKGRCIRCAAYYHNRGLERPLIDRPLCYGEPWPCGACGALTQPNDGRAHGRCHTCAARLRHRGQPRHLAPEAPCRTCSGPAPIGQRMKGECAPCYSYRKMRGVARPPHLWPGSTAPIPKGAKPGAGRRKRVAA